MSPMFHVESQQTEPQPFQTSEESWFKDHRGREMKRPFRSSPTMPPPPIGDALADGWFR